MTGFNMDFFMNDLDEIGLQLSDKQINSYFTYYETLIEWNQYMNLTAITDLQEVFKIHFIDSLTLVKAINLEDGISLIDIGCGAGFPGLALKIAFPSLKITLLDSLNKRIQFLNVVIDKLGLSEVKTLHGRAEDYARPDKLREQYDLSVSRAVANLSALSEYCLPYVKPGGKFIAYKSEKLSEEIMDAKGAIELLGGRIEKTIDFLLPGTDINRSLLVIDKVKKTPGKYPRKAGYPAKEPLKS